MHHRHLGRLVFVVLVVALVGISAWSAPLMPGGQTLLPDVYSLAEIHKLRLEVNPFPPALGKFDTTPQTLRDSWAKVLTDAGFEIVEPADTEDESLPTLGLQFMTAVDDAFPDALGFCAVMTLEQPVSLERIEYHMPATTFSSYAVGLEKKENVRKAIESSVENLARHFIGSQRQTQNAGR